MNFFKFWFILDNPNDKDLETERRALFKTPEKSTVESDEEMEDDDDIAVLPTLAKRILSLSVTSHNSTLSKTKSSASECQQLV